MPAQIGACWKGHMSLPFLKETEGVCVQAQTLVNVRKCLSSFINKKFITSSAPVPYAKAISLIPEGLPILFSKSHRIRSLAQIQLDKHEELVKATAEMDVTIKKVASQVRAMNEMLVLSTQQAAAENLNLIRQLELCMQQLHVKTGGAEGSMDGSTGLERAEVSIYLT